MKIFKNKNFKALIYSIFLAMPLLSFVPSTIYFAFNHNASNYIDPTIEETYEYETNVVNSNADLVIGNIYKLNATELHPSDFNENNIELVYVSGTMTFTSQNFLVDDWDFTNFTLNDCFIYMNFYGLEDSIYLNIYLSNENENVINILIEDAALISTDLYVIYKNGSGLYENSYEYFLQSDYLGQVTYTISNNEMNPLNVIENNIDKFINDNNFGKLDFFTWFTSLFLNNNQINNTYVHFVNWYMNYILYVSLAYLLFAVLMWFVNFFRSLVEKNMDLDL